MEQKKIKVSKVHSRVGLNLEMIGIIIYRTLQQNLFVNSKMEPMEPSTPKKKIYSSMIENSLHFKSKIENNLTLHRLCVPTHRLLEQLQLYKWRTQHQLHLINYQWLRIEPHNDREVTFILKPTKVLTSLQDIKLIKGKNIFKNIGKIFASFKLLYQRFGPFEVSAKMIAFDSFFDPFVWMNHNYILNEYTREHVTQFEFTQNILRLLLINADKFEAIDFAEKCYLVKGMSLSLSSIQNHFGNVDRSLIGQHQMKSPESECSQDCILNFTKVSKLKRRNTNTTSLKDSGSVKTISYPPTKLLIKPATDFCSFKNISSSLREQKRLSSVMSSLPLHSQKQASSINFTPQKHLEESFCFDDDMNHIKLSGFSTNNKLTVSVDESQSSEDDEVQQIVVPMLDQYLRCIASSYINPESQ